MVKRQYAGELSDVISSPGMSEHDSESTTPESVPSSPGMEHVRSIPSTAGGSPTGSTSSPRQRSLSDRIVEDDASAASRSFYQLQAHQIYISQQKLTMSSGSLKEESVSKDRSKKSTSRSSLISRKFRRLSRFDSPGTPEQSHRNSLPDMSDPSLYDSALLAGHTLNNSKRASTGSMPITGPGSLFRWMFQSGQSSNNSSSSKLSILGGSSSSNTDLVDRHGGERFSTGSPSTHSLVSQSTGSSKSLTLLMHSDHSSDVYRRGSGRSVSYPGLDHQLRYRHESRKYPEHLTTYAGRSIPEHSAVLNEYVDWLAQCHSYGIKSRAGFAMNGIAGPTATGAPLPGSGGVGGVHGLGIGTMATRPGDLFGDFSVFSLGMGGVVDASTIAGHHDEWISPGMAQMMMLRFPGLVVEWPKFWNNSRESGGPPPGPITTLPALAVVNNPALSLGKGNAGGVGGGVSAGAGGPFGGASLSGSSNGPSSLRHQQQAQMHHQQQMQLWSRNAAAAAAAAAAASASANGAAGEGVSTRGNSASAATDFSK